MGFRAEIRSFVGEGGRNGLLAVVGSWLALGAVYGLVNTAAVFQYHFSAHQLASYSESDISWIPSLQIFAVFFFSILVGPLFDRGQVRTLVILGSLFLSLSTLLLTWCTAYFHFILAYSLGGLGGAFLSCPTFGCIARHFEHHRGLATAIATTSPALFGVVFPVILDNTLPKLGFRWSCYILFTVIVVLLLPAVLFLK